MTSRIRRASWGRGLAWAMALWFGATALQPLAAAAAQAPVTAPAQAAERIEVLILPLVREETVQISPTLAADALSAVTESMRSDLDASALFAATVFLPTSPLVRRAVREQRLTEADIAALTTAPLSAETVDKVVTELGFTQGVVVTGDLAGYTYNASEGSVEMTLSLSVEDRRSEGAPKIVAVTGNSRPVAGASEERPLAIEAAQDAGRKAAAAIVQQLAAGTVAPGANGAVQNGKPLPPPATNLVRKRKNWTGVLAVLGAIALTLLVSGIGGNGNGTTTIPGGNGGTTPPPPPPGGGDTPPPPPPL